MKIGYARVSKADGTQVMDLQVDALKKAGVHKNRIYSDTASGAKDDRKGLNSCLKALRKGYSLIIWKQDRLGRSLMHLLNTIEGLKKRNGLGCQIFSIDLIMPRVGFE